MWLWPWDFFSEKLTKILIKYSFYPTFYSETQLTLFSQSPVIGWCRCWVLPPSLLGIYIPGKRDLVSLRERAETFFKKQGGITSKTESKNSKGGTTRYWSQTQLIWWWKFVLFIYCEFSAKGNLFFPAISLFKSMLPIWYIYYIQLIFW